MGYQTSTTIKVKCDQFREVNTKNHHTDEYINNSLVLRRGGMFMTGMKFDGIQFPEISSLKLRFSMGECVIFILSSCIHIEYAKKERKQTCGFKDLIKNTSLILHVSALE